MAVAADAPTNVEPSAAVQKRAVETQMEGRKVFYNPRVLPFGMWGAALAAGATGVEGARGTESGR